MRRALFFAGAAALLAGCGGGAQHAANTIAAAGGQRLTLPPTALRAPFLEFDRGKQGFAYRGPGQRGDPRRFGRVAGWVARYHRPGTNTTKGPLVIDSNADVFGDSAGAKKDLASLQADLAKLYPVRVSVAPLGEESFARTLKTGSGSFAVRYYTIAWRDRNVVAALTVNGFEGRITLRDASRLARVQERKIAAAR